MRTADAEAYADAGRRVTATDFRPSRRPLAPPADLRTLCNPAEHSHAALGLIAGQSRSDGSSVAVDRESTIVGRTDLDRGHQALRPSITPSCSRPAGVICHVEKVPPR